MGGERRILCIGLDGATFDVLAPWMEDGTLPTLAALRSSGVWGHLASTVPPLTAPAWTSFMTGQNPGNHGVFHFLDLSDHRAMARGERRLIDLTRVRAPSIWDFVAHDGGRVGLINIPMTYPPRQVNGLMITGMLTPPGAPFTYPESLATQIPGYRIDIERFSGLRPFARDLEDNPAVDDVESLVREYQRLLVMRGQVAHQLLTQEPWHFFMVVFTGTDRLGHYAWPYHHTDSTANGHSRAAERCRAVYEYYQELDRVLGRLIEAAGPDAITIVMSDHGMGPVWHRRVHLNAWLYRQGLLAIDQRGKKVSRADDWLFRLGIPREQLARFVRSVRLPKRVIRQASRVGGLPIDFEASRAFYVHVYNHVGGIRINAEPSSTEHRELAEQLMHELRAMRDSETGQPIFWRVAPRSEFFHGPFTEQMPDLITIADPQYAASVRVSYRSDLVTRRYDAQVMGAHRDRGIFMASGPGIRGRGAELSNLHIEDLAPTILYLLGCSVPVAMDGRVLGEALVEGRLETEPVKTTTEDRGRWPEGNVTAGVGHDAAGEQQVLEHLRSLGYL